MIQKLPPHLIHQIAAGEVIERPASALKELIENSIDADASKISIRYRRGGVDLLEIEDDGVGMTAEDLELAFEAHATSKLSKMEDFDALLTFGFRGEALASLGSVADVTFETSERSGAFGLCLRNAFGLKTDIKKIDKRVGSLVRVERLFERLTARREFLKSDRSESMALQQVFKKYALAYPELAWEMRDLDSDRVWRFPKREKFEASLQYFQSAEPEDWLQISEERGPWRLQIISLKPRALGRVSSGIQVFLNRRPIRDLKIEVALRRAYEGFTEFPRDVAAVIYLDGPAHLFDVNVHPMKHEVRFKNADEVFSAVHRSCRDQLDTSHREREEKPASLSAFSSPPSSFLRAKSAPLLVETSIQETSLSTEFVHAVTPPLFSRPAEESFYEFLFSIDQTFWVCRGENGELYLFDQHALHERILYESLLKAFESGEALASQRLLFPVALKFPEAENLLLHEEELKRFGFEVRQYGAGRVSMICAPEILKRKPEEALRPLAEAWGGGVELVIRDVLSTMACHAALRAHDLVQDEQRREILKLFHSQDSLGHCPHGRPTFVKWGVKELEKLFHRVL